MSNYYYHYMGNAKKLINIFYSLNKVTYSPRYALQIGRRVTHLLKFMFDF